MHTYIPSMQQSNNRVSFSAATKELENPKDTAEKVGISALIVQVESSYFLFHLSA